ncbi:hypothetical protein Tco_1023296 [Tanacetum coccineum]
MVKHDVEVDSLGECVDDIDKLTEVIGEMQLKKEDQSYVHASNELTNTSLAVVHVVAAMSSALSSCVSSVRDFKELIPAIDNHWLNFGGKDSGGGGMCLSMGVEKKRGVKDGKKTRSTAQIPPSVIPISIPEPDVPITLPKTTPIPESDFPKSLPKSKIPYPSRRNDQKSHDKDSNQMEKIFQIFPRFALRH